MSERYGPCKTCGGSGKVQVMDKEGSFFEEECPTCSGEGFSGDVFDNRDQWEDPIPPDRDLQ